MYTHAHTCSGSGQGSSGASTDSACVSLALHAFGEGEVVVLAACKDARLRLWSCEVRTVGKFCGGFLFLWMNTISSKFIPPYTSYEHEI